MKKSDFIERTFVQEVYSRPLLELIGEASSVHSVSFPEKELFLSTLISYKTGGCVEDCAYCAQSIKHRGKAAKAVYLTEDLILKQAAQAMENGAGRVCISSSWRRVPDNDEFEMILRVGKKIRKMGLEVCATMGTISDLQVKRIQDAGFSAYNHNLDTGEKYYPKIITTRTYSERLDTLSRIQKLGMNCCSGGIIGMGESHDDRIDMLYTLANREKPLFTIPLNVLVPIPGTPLEKAEPVSFWDMLRVIATARIIMPKSRICLAAGRTEMSEEQQTLCFMVGVNAVFVGEKLLTTNNNDLRSDMRLFEKLQLKIK